MVNIGDKMLVGNYSIPDSPNRLPDLLDLLKKIYDIYTREDIKDVLKNDGLAKLLNYKSSNNGSYQRKIRAFRDYGLLEGKGDLRVSIRGENILYGPEEDKNKALQDAFLSVPLWNKLYDKFRKDLPASDFWLHLKEITGCSPKDAQDMENAVREAFTRDASVMVSAGMHQEERRPSPIEKDIETMNVEQRPIVAHSSDEGEVALTALYRLGAYDIATQLIEFLKEKKNTKPKKEEES